MNRGHPLTGGDVRLVAAAEDQVTLRRIEIAMLELGAGQPMRALCPEEVVAAATAEGALVALACDVSDPARIGSLRRLRKRAERALIVVVTPPTDGSGVRRALDAGAQAVVFESRLESALGPTAAAVAAGQTAVPRDLRAALQRPAFSHREREVLTHVAGGLTNGEIASALFLSESTVKSHLSSAFAKLGVHSRREAAALLLDPDEGLAAGLLAVGVPIATDPVSPGGAAARRRRPAP